MKNVLMDTYDRLVLVKRGIIESVNMKLKLGCQIEHHRHRSVSNFMTNLLAGLVSYSMDPYKPEIGPLHLKKCFSWSATGVMEGIVVKNFYDRNSATLGRGSLYPRDRLPFLSPYPLNSRIRWARQYWWILSDFS